MNVIEIAPSLFDANAGFLNDEIQIITQAGADAITVHAEAWADLLVAGSAVFGEKDRKNALQVILDGCSSQIVGQREN